MLTQGTAARILLYLKHCALIVWEEGEEEIPLIVSYNAHFQMKSSIKLIKEHSKIAESLLNALRSL